MWSNSDSERNFNCSVVRVWTDGLTDTERHTLQVAHSEKFKMNRNGNSILSENICDLLLV